MPLSREQVDCEQFFRLFDQLDDVTFFMKDVDGRYEVFCDGTARGVLAARGDTIVNLTDFEIYPESVAIRLAQDDRRVIQSRQPLINAVEFLVSPQHLMIGWYVLNRFPICSQGSDEVLGVMGTIQPYESRRRALLSGSELDGVIERIRLAPEVQYRVEELADFTGISPRQLGRRFQQVLGMSPREFIASCRAMKACELLTHTQKSMTDIALDCGYYDQSDLTRHFQRLLGIAPSSFRKRYQEHHNRS